MHEALAAARRDLPSERVEPADKRTIGMDRAASVPKKNAGAVFRAGKMKALAVLRPARAKLGRPDTAVRRQACDLVRIHLNELVVAAMRTAAARKAEWLRAGFR